jgi:fructose-1,6-bisphosphatase I
LPPRTLTNALESEDQAYRKLVSLLADLSQEVVAQIPHSLGVTRGVNIYGETQTEIDVWANELFTSRLLKSGLVREVASEEMEKTLTSNKGEFSIVLDPLDGSSNLSTDNLVGTIMGVYSNIRLPARGRDLLSSMYFLYGPYVETVLATKEGVYVAVGAGSGKGTERLLCSGEPHSLPQKPSTYGIGGSREKWTKETREFVDRLEKRKLKLRYGGCFVGDYNQVLHNGGFFAYPALLDAPNGKYRLQFESNPIGFITEKAGGKASSGSQDILDIEPTGLDQRTPTYLGNRELVSEFESLVAKSTPSRVA